MTADDTVAIVGTVNLYAVALDSHRYDLFDTVFTPDVRCDFGGGAAFVGRETLVGGFKTIHAVFHATQHIISGHVVRADGADARCLSYVSGRFLREIDGKLAVFESTGWYDDRLVRATGGWRITERLSRMVTAGGDIRVMQAMPGVDTDYALLSLAAEADAGRVGFFA